MQFMVQVVRSKRTDDITLTLKLDDVEVRFFFFKVIKQVVRSFV